MEFSTILETDIQSILLLISSLISFIVAWLVYKRRKTQISSRYFALAAGSIGVWVVSRAMLQLAQTYKVASFWGYFLFIPTTFIIIFLLYFSIYIGREKRHLSKFTHTIILAPWTVLFLTVIIPGLVFKSVLINPTGINEIIYGPYFKIVFVPVMIIYLISYFPILIRTYIKSSIDTKIKLRYVIFGMSTSILISLSVNLVLPVFGLTNLVSLGPLTASVLVVTIGYALLRKELWNFRLFITEIIIYTILLFLLIDIFISKNTLGIVFFKVTTIAFMIVFSWFLIRGIFKEFQAKQHMQQLTKQLTIANKRLQEIDVEKSEFVSIATHQLRTPLTVIKGYASMLLEGSLGPIKNPKHKEIINKIFNASQRLVAMIEDFLNISRIEKGEITYNFKKIDIKKLIKDINEEFSASIEGLKIPIHIYIDENKNFYAIADELKLRQVLTNLLDNALKYSPNNSPIDIGINTESNNIIISVHDNGIGINKDALPKLFKKYSRTEQTVKLHKEGRGLGLYIAKQIIEGHGGEIWAESEGKNQGSTFYVSLRIAKKNNELEKVRSFVKNIKT